MLEDLEKIPDASIVLSGEWAAAALTAAVHPAKNAKSHDMPDPIEWFSTFQIYTDVLGLMIASPRPMASGYS